MNIDLNQPPVICLMGPTATGKTDAAAQLSQYMDIEIISVDSSLVYRRMDIGTAKPDAEFLKTYPHHLVDIREPWETYSVADFYHDCTRLVAEVCQRGKVPVLVGGTMFYYNALEQGLANLPKANQALRTQISEEAQALGWRSMHEKLQNLDPKRAEQIDPNDAQRIQRALELVLSLGESVADSSQQRFPALPNPMIKIALCYSDRHTLHANIAKRFDIMLDMGLQSEVERLLDEGFDHDVPAMRMIGYRQMVEYLKSDAVNRGSSVTESAFSEMKLKGVAATRQLAKRQLTWLRNQSNLIWWTDNGLRNKNFNQLVRFINNYRSLFNV
jgi:tRNA dimethylallyltransferase